MLFKLYHYASLWLGSFDRFYNFIRWFSNIVSNILFYLCAAYWGWADDYGPNSSSIVLSSPEECARSCTDFEEPRNCYYSFNIEFYTTVGPYVLIYIYILNNILSLDHVCNIWQEIHVNTLVATIVINELRFIKLRRMIKITYISWTKKLSTTRMVLITIVRKTWTDII